MDIFYVTGILAFAIVTLLIIKACSKLGGTR